MSGDGAKRPPHKDDWLTVTSSTVTALYWRWTGEGGSGVLFVRFKTGRVYSFLNVPFAVAEELYHADSKGRAFHQLVKDRYDTQLVSKGRGRT